MKIFRNLWNVLRRKPEFLLEHKGKISEAFVYQGRTYYMFENIFLLPTIRGLQALDYYDEFSMRCTKEFLKAFCEAQKNILSNPKKLDLVQLAKLTNYLEERLNMIPVPDHIFRLASVMFFDSSENPLFFDRAYAEKKIELWKKDPEILAFFLRTPLKSLIPYLEWEQASSSIYSGIVEKVNQLHLKAVSSHLSAKDTKVAM